ncbi:formate dehydrogenase subunit gamma [Chloroflexota bacterium]
MATRIEAISTEKISEEKISRFDVHQIIQHAGLMVSFILLVVTGLPLKFYSWPISQWWIGVWGGIEVTRSTHNFAAWMMAIVCLYHIVYLIYTILILKRPFPVKMLPSLKDFREVYQEIAYFVGLRKERPLIDRFNWKEKFDYYAIFWGMPVMFLSGFVLMYPVLVTKFLPGWLVPAALVAHSDEALLALTWIFLVHIFFNHFSPGIFPINTSIFTGKVSKERYRREHTLEYERLMEADNIEDED